MSAFLVALGIVLVAELGDKTQLVVLTFGARHRPLAALAALGAAAAVLMGLAVTGGAALGAVLPERVATALAGVLFLGFAVWTWREAAETDADLPARDGPDEALRPGRGRGLTALAVSFFVAELGDKTQLTAASLATRNGALATWAGATLGLVAATALALLVGVWLRRRVGPRRLALLGAGAFALVGVVALGLAAVG